ncbi:unnamed protein product [Gadus morhua 'NCC']
MKHLSDSFPTPLNCFPTPMNRIHTPLNHIQPPSTNHCSPEASPTPLQHAPPCSPRGLCGRPRGDGTDRGKEEWWEDKLSAAFDAADPKEYSKLGCQPPRSEGVPLEKGTEWEPYRRGGKTTQTSRPPCQLVDMAQSRGETRFHYPPIHKRPFPSDLHWPLRTTSPDHMPFIPNLNTRKGYTCEGPQMETLNAS